MIRKTAIAMLLAAAGANAQALTAGDIAFTSFNADEDGLSFVTFATIAPNTQIYFSDNEWTGSAFNTGESYNVWNSGTNAIAAGSVVRLLAYDKTTLAASVGSLARVSVSGSSNWGIANSNETIYAYLGTNASAPTTFLARGGQQAIVNFLANQATGGTRPTTFDLFTHASVSSLTAPGGGNFSTPGLNSAYEITMIMGFGERVTFAAQLPNDAGLAMFETTPGGVLSDGSPAFFEMFVSPVNANQLSGSGFGDGIRVLSASLISSSSTGSSAVRPPAPAAAPRAAIARRPSVGENAMAKYVYPLGTW